MMMETNQLKKPRFKPLSVECIDAYEIEAKLKSSKRKEDKEIWNYIQRLKEAFFRQQEITKMAINKLNAIK